MVFEGLEVRLVRSERRTAAIEVDRDGSVVFRAPARMTEKEILEILRQKSAWVHSHAEKARQRSTPAQPPLTGEEVRALARQAARDLTERAAFHARRLQVTYGRITIRCQKTRWGSCSAEGNLNFNCLLMLCPERVREYVVIHELCHRKEMNHSRRFWALVEAMMPDWAAQRAWLKEQGPVLLARVYGP